MGATGIVGNRNDLVGNGDAVLRQLKRVLYAFFRGILRGVSWCAWDLRVTRKPPRLREARIYVCNHVTSVDPYWLMTAIPEFPHFVVGPPYALKHLRPWLVFFEQINALPEFRKSVVEHACRHLANKESVCIYPEGDVQRPFSLGHFYTGLAKMYRLSGAPIVPVALAVSPDNIRHYPRWDIPLEGKIFEARLVWRGKVRINIGKPMTPELCKDLGEEEDDRRITDLVRDQIGSMLDELKPELGG